MWGQKEEVITVEEAQEKTKNILVMNSNNIESLILG